MSATPAAACLVRVLVILFGVVELAGCASIPPPREQDGGAMEPRDATRDATRDAAPACASMERTSSGRGSVIFLHEGAVADRRVAWTFDLVRIDGVVGLLEVALVGDMNALEDAQDVVELGGAESSLRTCRHCVLFWPACDIVPDLCTGQPYVAVSGEAYVYDAPSSDAENAFDIALGNVRFVRASVDTRTLETSLVSGGDCVSLDFARLAGHVEETDCTFSHVACALATTSDR